MQRLLDEAPVNLVKLDIKMLVLISFFILKD